MKLLCFGDSNTYGYAPRSFLGERYAAPWPALLQAETGWEIINAGQNGREIPHGAYQFQQFERLLACYGTFDRMTIMLGGNDLLQNSSFTAKDTAARMEVFLQHLLKSASPSSLLLIAPPLMQPGVWVTEERLLRESAMLGAEYDALAKKLGVPFADSAHWGVEVVFDGVHFSEDGHRAFANGLRPFLQ